MEKDVLEKLIENGHTVDTLKFHFNKSTTTIRYWLKKYGLNANLKRHDGKWDKENLESAIKGAFSLADVIRNLGLDLKAGHYRTLYKYAQIYNITLPKFKNNYHKKSKEDFNRKSDEEIFIKDSLVSRSCTKRRYFQLLESNPQCSLCGQGEMWRGKKISLILDHINGVNNDNRLENLQLVCPNCNATLPTHCKGKKGLILKTKNEPTREEILAKRTVERPPFDQLLKEIKELGYKGTGNKYGVADNTIRKWIKAFEKFGF